MRFLPSITGKTAFSTFQTACQGRKWEAKKEAKCLAEQICRLVEATHGHTLVLFTSYSLMGAVYNQVKDRLSFPLMEVWRHSQEVIHQFKQAQNAVLFAAGSCWEGVDFPGDMVSSLDYCAAALSLFPDPLSEAEREQYPTLQDYIRAVVIPGYAGETPSGIRAGDPGTETDTCVVSILDHRAAPKAITIGLCWKPCLHSVSPEK